MNYIHFVHVFDRIKSLQGQLHCSAQCETIIDTFTTQVAETIAAQLHDQISEISVRATFNEFGKVTVLFQTF